MAIQWSSEKIDWMLAVPRSRLHAVDCNCSIADSMEQVSGLHSGRVTDGASGPSQLIVVFLRHFCMWLPITKRDAIWKKWRTNIEDN